jgi:hypothetical protein
MVGPEHTNAVVFQVVLPQSHGLLIS